MIISHNLQAMNTNRIVNANINAHAKSTRKISSGYNINVAYDNPAGLAMSETMRKQIRGLMQGINNTKDGCAFVQIADGAMDEVHAMLQRMNELSLKSLNGLCTPEDRAALNAEFDQLRTEIDRINDTTTFNTLPVFDNHEASYYQIAGNRKWGDNQRHTISSSANELNIHLPDGYEPKDYTITVPAGTYTTQELIDEIDDALNQMTPPNPGFVFEYTKDGYCKLNFENAEGEPTKIASVDGSLAYLIYDFKSGGSPASLLGTSSFELDQYGRPRKLTITEGKNDELGFFAESAKDPSKYISITIEPGEYTRDEMIKKINEKLADVEDADGIAAKPYGDFYIQITGGDTVNITGLKGNMFKYEPSYPKYTSVFYDNEVYGSCDKEGAQITGYSHTHKIKIYADTPNQNNILYFKLNGDSDARTITLPAGEYTVSELTDKVNEALETAGLGDEAEAVYTNGRLELSSRKKGTQSGLIFTVDSTVNAADAKIYNKAYETLFHSISGYPIITGQPASVTGAAYLNGSIDLAPDATLSFKVDGKEYTVGSDIIGGSHASLSSLVGKLNGFVKNTPDLDGKIEFGTSGSQLVIRSKSDSGVKNLSISDTNETYRKLFTRTYAIQNGSFSGAAWGKKEEDQGRPEVYINVPASINAGPCKFPVTIDGTNNQIRLSLYNSTINKYEYITFNLDSDTYNDMGALSGAINEKLSGLGNPYASHISAAPNGNALKFIFTPPEDKSIPDGSLLLTISQTSAWNAIFGTSETTAGPSVRPAGDAELRSVWPAPDSITLDDRSQNNKLRLVVGGKTYDLTINRTCNSKADILAALQSAIANSPLNGTVTASLLNGNYLRLSAKSDSLAVSGTFYNEVLCKGVVGAPSSYRQNGTCTFETTRVIGRKDLTKEPIRILAGFNDTLTFDFTYNKDPDSTEEAFESFNKTIDVTIPEKLYNNGQELVTALNEAVKQQFGENGVFSEDSVFGTDGDFEISFSIGGYDTNVYNSVDPLALQIAVNRKKGKEPGEGEYIIDGVRGNASCFAFYKTASLPAATYIVGTKDIKEGITFEPGRNVLTLSANSEPYQYTFEENKFYTADDFIKELNRRFTEGDDNGNPAPLRATLENGAVKIWHKTVGANTITDIGGGARSTIFFEEEGRDSRDPLILQVGAEQRSTLELPRIRVDSSSLSINSITISQEKYAEKAVEHIKSAIKSLSDRRSTYGAMQNRLEHTINNNDNVTEQIQASESRIRDTDISSEMIKYSNLSILLKTGERMITHSNNNIKKLLTLLG